MSRRKPNRPTSIAQWKAKPMQSKKTQKNKQKSGQNNCHSNKTEKKKETEIDEKWKSENLEEQKSEIDSIRDIYSTEITVIKEPSSYQFKIINDENKSQEIIFDIKCPIQYPSKLPPNYSISTTFLKQIPNRMEIENKFKTIWNENKGQCIMFEWISEFQEFASIIFTSNTDDNKDDNTNNKNDNNNYCYIPIKQQRNKLNACPNIIFCDKFIEDRKSLFKSYAADVTDIDEIKAFIDKLKSNKKILKATHNMIGYRLSSSSSGIINEHYDDDGEHGGGKVILEILRKRNIMDIVIMVSRWYGGIHLSSDRFKHIKSMTQYVLQQKNKDKEDKKKDKDKDKGNKQIKPNSKNIEIGTQILNRLYWNENTNFNRNDLYIGCKCNDKKLHDIIEFNLDEYGVQKNGIQWIEYICYKGLLIWDIWNLCRDFDEINQIIQNM